MKCIIAPILCCLPVTLYADSIVLNVLHQPPYVIDSEELEGDHHSGRVHRFYGLDVDIVRSAYASQGVQVQFKPQAWQRTLRNIKTGRALGSLVCRYVPERESFAWFSDEVVASSVALVAPQGSINEEELDFSDLSQFNSINVVQGWSQENYLKQAGFSYRAVGGQVQGLNIVANRPQGGVFYRVFKRIIFV